MSCEINKLIIVKSGIFIAFQIVPNNFPVLQDGILGMAFLKQQGAILSILGADIYLGSDELPAIAYKAICLPARAKTLVKIPLKDNNLLEGTATYS